MVKRIDFNWRQTRDKEGLVENYTSYEVGQSGVYNIEENEPHNGNEVWNYVVNTHDGRKFRVFNPNFVEYFPKKEKTK